MAGIRNQPFLIFFPVFKKFASLLRLCATEDQGTTAGSVPLIRLNVDTVFVQNN